MKNRNRFDGIDPRAIILSVLFGLLWAIVGNILYHALCDVLWTPLVVGLYFAGLAVTQILAIQIYGHTRHVYAKGAYVGNALALILAVLVAATALDFVYELEGKKVSNEPTSYIFLIDDSSSMSTNDPNMLRSDAIGQVMASCQDDFPYAVYSFSSDCRQILPITPASEAPSRTYSFVDSGGTDIVSAITHVLSDLKTGKLQGAGDAPRIILTSDGNSYEIGLTGVLKNANSQNVSICTVGFGQSNDTLLEKIASGTNGVSLRVEDVGQLANAIENAANAETENTHNLLNRREGMHNDWLYVIMRISFTLVLGILFLIIKANLLRTNAEGSDVLPAYLLLLIPQALSLELCINTLGVPEGLGRCVMCVMFLLTINPLKSEGRTGHTEGSEYTYTGENYGKVGADGFQDF